MPNLQAGPACNAEKLTDVQHAVVVSYEETETQKHRNTWLVIALHHSSPERLYHFEVMILLFGCQTCY